MHRELTVSPGGGHVACVWGGGDVKVETALRTLRGVDQSPCLPQEGTGRQHDCTEVLWSQTANTRRWMEFAV